MDPKIVVECNDKCNTMNAVLFVSYLFCPYLDSHQLGSAPPPLTTKTAKSFVVKGLFLKPSFLSIFAELYLLVDFKTMITS